MTLPLLPYQKIGATFLSGRDRAGLFDEPGLGKTAQAIGGADAAGVKQILVVCPASAREVWRGEFKKFAKLPRKVLKCKSIDDVNLWLRGRVDVLIISYDHAKKWRKALASDLIPLIIFDESHYMKEPTSQRTRAMIGSNCNGREGLASWGIQVWFLTGTDMPDDPMDAWPFLRFSGATRLERAAFGKRYFHQRSGTYNIRYRPRKEMVDELRLVRKAVILKRSLAEVDIELPPVFVTTATIDGDTAAIRALLAEWPGLEQSIVDAIEAGGLSKLDVEHIATLRRLVGEAKAPAYLQTLIDELKGTKEKIVVFGIHTNAINTIYEGLNRAGIKAVKYTGGTPEKDRGPIVQAFQTDPAVRVFVGQMKAAGLAITLTAAARIDLFEYAWSPADNSQALKRVHRIGQTRRVRGRIWALANSIDENVMNVVAEKTAAIAMIDGR